MKMLYFRGYKIKDSRLLLTGEEMRVLHACCWMVEKEATIRKTAKEYGYTSSTFWNRIHRVCSDLSPELYEAVKSRMRENLERRNREMSGKN